MLSAEGSADGWEPAVATVGVYLWHCQNKHHSMDCSTVQAYDGFVERGVSAVDGKCCENLDGCKRRQVGYPIVSEYGVEDR